jgi:hypothetical protein
MAPRSCGVAADMTQYYFTLLSPGRVGLGQVLSPCHRFGPSCHAQGMADEAMEVVETVLLVPQCPRAATTRPKKRDPPG